MTMSKEQASTYPIPDRWSYLWLAIAAVLTLFSSGRWPIPLALWLVAVFVLRFLRTQKIFRGLFLVSLVIYVVGVIAWWGMMTPSIPTSAYFGIMAANLLVLASLPYLADRLLVPRLKGFAATLAFPLAVTALEFLGLRLNPMGTFGARAYTLYGNLALMQLLSLTGMWGITFLVSWFASVVNWAWERSFDWPKIWRGLAIYAGITGLVLFYGSARLVFSPAPVGTVRVAGLTMTLPDEAESLDWRDDREDVRQMISDLRDRYFEGTIREARAGARLVLWPEGAGVGYEEDEAALIARGRQVAAQEGIYLAMPLFTLSEDPDRRHENKLIVIDPAGDVVLEHYKYGFNISEGSQPGDGVLHTSKTPFGTLSGVVCWDDTFPAAIRQAGRNGTDILMVPADDHREVAPLRMQMAVYRAIENGVSLVRQGNEGLSLATDPYGRVVGVMDHFSASERVMGAQVPTQGVFTIYAVIGDLFGWLAMVGFVGIAVWGVVRWRKAKRAESTSTGTQVPA
jgi:apolipoprotein N-acyltransferase